MSPVVEQKITEHFQRKGLRMTSQRRQIIEMIFESDDHFTTEELLDRAGRLGGGQKTARATIYRTLSMLIDAGVLSEIDLGKGQRVFDPNFNENPNHNHLICIDCGKVVEFEDSHMEVLEDCLTRRMGFRPARKSLKIEACCEQLRKEGLCENLLKARLGTN